MISNSRADQAVVAAYGFLVTALVAGSSGGFFSTSWGWVALTTGALGIVALTVGRRVELGATGLLLAATLGAFAIWVAASNLWTLSATATMHDLQRDLAYFAATACALVLVRGRFDALAGGALAGITVESLYGLSTRLLPGRFTDFDSKSFGYRLSPPITYWNGLGIFAAMGLLTALAFAVRARSVWARAAAAAALPGLAATMYFTFSRGAWYALAAGVLAVVIVDPRRLQWIGATLPLALWPVLAVVEIRRSPGLVTFGATLQQATHDGHRLIPRLILLAAAAAVTAVVVANVERRVAFPQLVRFAFAIVLVVLAVGSLAAVWVREGSPMTLAKKGWTAFNSAPTGGQGDVGTRLLSLSGNNRTLQWHVSIRTFKASPLLGDGAGTFAMDWVRYRSAPTTTTQPHSLYLGVLGELGAVGLALIVALVLLPIVAAVRSRRVGLVPPLLGAFVAWAVHAGVDWDWALAGVTLPALLLGTSLAAAAPDRQLRLRMPHRLVAGAALVVVILVAVPSLIADTKLRAGNAEVFAHPAAALDAADRAATFAPWSSEPDRLRARVYERLGRNAGAAKAVRAALVKDPLSWSLWKALASVTSGPERQQALSKERQLNPFEAAGKD
jgi:hypothetical protein